MKLEEAIDRGKELKGELVREGRQEKANSLQILIEAGKWRLQIEREDPEIELEPLPGETKE